MVCPNCQNNKGRVVDSRPNMDGSAIVRRRHCANCNTKYSTYEISEELFKAAKIVTANDVEVHALCDKSLSSIIKAIEYLTNTKENISQVGDKLRQAPKKAKTKFLRDAAGAKVRIAGPKREWPVKTS